MAFPCILWHFKHCPSHWSQWWTKKEWEQWWFSLNGISAPCFLHCFDIVGRVAGRASSRWKPVPLIQKGSLPEKVEEENQGEPADWASLLDDVGRSGVQQPLLAQRTRKGMSILAMSQEIFEEVFISLFLPLEGWWRWALPSPDGDTPTILLGATQAPSRMVDVSASVDLTLHHKVEKFSYGTGSPGWFRKKGHKMVVVVVFLSSWLLTQIISIV